LSLTIFCSPVGITEADQAKPGTFRDQGCVKQTCHYSLM